MVAQERRWPIPGDRRQLVARDHQSLSRARSVRSKSRYDPEPAARRARRAGNPGSAHGLPAGRIHRPGQVGGGGAVMKADKIIGAVQDVTKKWAKQRKREERDSAAAMNRRHVMMHRRS